MKNKLFIYILVLITFSNCKKDNTIETQIPSIETGKLKIEFAHTINNQPIQLNTNIYVNEAGNHYELTDLMYFISDVILYPRNGVFFPIDDLTAIHYVDIHIPNTLTWNIYDPIPTDIYDSISFIFGLNEQRNQSNAFVNPPESNMAWPDILGGGYHYMMMNGKWVNLQGILKPFNFHLGIGQIYTDTINYDINTITSFVQNYFKITLPLSALEISKNNTTTIKLNMSIDSWFKTPHNWNFNNWGGNVMQNQHALQTIRENGFDVFTITNK
jgi:hypothetical protein